MIPLYNRKDSCMVVGGILFYHILVVGLCSFWVYRFLLKTYDSGVWFLLAIFIFATIICDILLFRIQGISRFLIRARVDQFGIHLVLLARKWSIQWDDVRTFGATGFSGSYTMPIIFFSKIPREKHSKDGLAAISDSRIVFQFDEVRWAVLSVYMPDDIKGKLHKVFTEKRDCYCFR